MKKIVIDAERIEAADIELQKFQKQVEYDTKDYTLELILSKFRRGDFFIPEYQRKFVWKPNNKSLFIESVLLGLPIPFMFFASRPDGTLEIIDGAQRIQTLNEFVYEGMRLTKLPKLTFLEGFRFQNLSVSTQRKFFNRAFRIVVLDEKTTEDIRQDLFNRINTTGVKASDSEIRRGSYPGELTKFIDSCCKNELFIRLCPIPDGKVSRQERFELVLRFFAYLYNYPKFSQDVRSFLDRYLRDNQSTFNRDLYQADFEQMLRFIDTYFEYGFAKCKNSTTTPRVRFEAISVGVALALKERPDLSVIDVNWVNSDDFKYYTTSDASNNQGKLQARVEFVKNKLLGN